MKLDPNYDVATDDRLAPMSLGVYDPGDIMPTYDHICTALAGWHAARRSAVITVRGEQHDATGLSATVPMTFTPWAPFARDERLELLATVRRTYGDTLSARQALRACRTLATMRNTVAAEIKRREVIALTNIGDEVTRRDSLVPDASVGAQHSITARRSRKGTTSKTVTRYGIPTVQGATDRDADGNDTDVALAVLLDGARVRSAGRNAHDITAVTQSFYGDDLPTVTLANGKQTTLLGGDATMFEDISREDAGAHVALLAHHTADLSGSPVGAINRHCITWNHDADARRDQTQAMTWPASVQRLTGRPRKNETAPIHAWQCDRTGAITPVRIGTALPAAHTNGRITIGHNRPVERGSLAASTIARMATRGNLIARTEPLERVPETVLAWEVLIGDMRPGSRHTAETDDGSRITVTRTTGDRFTARCVLADGTKARWTVRSAESLAERLHGALSA